MTRNRLTILADFEALDRFKEMNRLQETEWSRRREQVLTAKLTEELGINTLKGLWLAQLIGINGDDLLFFIEERLSEASRSTQPIDLPTEGLALPSHRS